MLEPEGPVCIFMRVGMGLSGLAVFGDLPLVGHLGTVSNGRSLQVQTLLRV